ncbi:MAG: UDP-3-O-(3-hydroxymyristoyl)glucosamine N-acyltransferase [Bacteroidetes bacterium SW_11_45_7]|nr:MAG: UDP-3-O-(3-hydroxymyristoyl)glucosamine N-acyltransferase [Bacteroidetes bacterium SW_11_45_7]
MILTAAELNTSLNGRLEGNAEVEVTGPAPIESATKEEVTFLANPQYAKYAAETSASVIIVSKDFQRPSGFEPTIIRVSNPYQSFTRVMELFQQEDTGLTGIHEQAFVAESATIANHVSVGANTYIGENVEVGENVSVFGNVYIGNRVVIDKDTMIYPGTVIYRNCRIGKNCIVHGGTVIGSDGFGFTPQDDGHYRKIPQMGNVIIEDHVEIGANCSIDRATLGSTVIRHGVKLDNLIQVAHNVEIGEHTVVAAQAGISGSTQLGNHCVVGGQVGFVGHIKVAEGNQFQAQSGVPRTIDDKGKAWAGSPAFDYRQALKSQVVYQRLPEVEKRIQSLEQEIQRLQQQENKDANHDE